MSLPLSVLDLSPVGQGVAPSQAIRDSIALARVADDLGYTRYWFAEHHNMASIATSAPEVLIANAAAVTSRIKLGAGGIMVPNHAPLHVVEMFRILSVEEALAYEMTPEERAIADEFFEGAVIGSPATVVTRLRALARETGADEIMLSSLVPDREARARSLRLVATAMGLANKQAA